ncbi:MAG: cytochrome c-type biogenesis CcmF C-terminal domain-containing protein [Polyangiales bacterium]
MAAIDIPFFGNLILCLILASAGYTFAMALAASRGRANLLAAARLGTYATSAFVALAVVLLAYAFQTHDFRITYVARYSDRSMPWWYLVASLWGGQDGSLLWWTFLLAGYTTAVTIWMRGRYLELQPWVLATLMSIFGFFSLLMLFPANPFATFAASVPLDGEGLNPLLQNYWMTIHPPSLYMGFVGWAIPFGFVVAGLATGRLDDEWMKAARPWAMVAWTFLSLGLLLGCLWSYEELGWGGYWAWDPVENASFMPWLAGTAYLHSAIVQERRGMLKVWNVFLLCLTFFMTIYGTFLTRSGLIASVHSFARSDIGQYFVAYMVVLGVAMIAAIVWRVPKLRAEHRIESLLSREFAFLLNNWILLGMMLFVLGATMYPLISEWLRDETVTVGPPFYNKWMVPFGLVLMLLAGVGPLIAWRKATAKNLVDALKWPTGLSIATLLAHVFAGRAVGFPAYVASEEIYDTATGRVLAELHAIAPALSTFACMFVLASVGQEFVRGAGVRVRTKKESWPVAMLRLVGRARRRYGGYIVHLGVMLMFVGFTGAAYDVEREAALRPGATVDVGGFRLRYDAPRMEVDPNKRMVFTDLAVEDRAGRTLGHVSPAKFIYRTAPEMPTTEVAIRSRPREDLYVIMSTVDPQTRRGTFKVMVRPLVAWIWAGGLVVLFGAIVAVWPSAAVIVSEPKRRRSGPRKGLTLATAALLLLALLGLPFLAQAQDSSTLHAGHVEIHDHDERLLFSRLLCQCGSCPRLPLDSCICGWAEEKRNELRARLAAGENVRTLQASYRALYGAKAIAVPSDQGMDRALWAVPVAILIAAAGGLFVLGKRWRDRGALETAPEGPEASDYDARLDDELSRRSEDA